MNDHTFPPTPPDRPGSDATSLPQQGQQAYPPSPPSQSPGAQQPAYPPPPPPSQPPQYPYSQPGYPYPAPPSQQPQQPTYPTYPIQGPAQYAPPSQPLYPPPNGQSAAPSTPMYSAQGPTVPPTYPAALYAAMPRPPRRGLKAWHWILIGVGSFLVVCCVLGGIAFALAPSNPTGQNTLASATNTSGPTNTPAPTATPLPTATPVPTDTPQPTATPAKPKVVLDLSGSQTQRTPPFSVSGTSQQIDWWCDPSTGIGGTYNIIIDVYTTDGTDIENAVNDMCEQGNTSGSATVYLAAGSYKLDIFTDLGWYQVKVTDLP